MDLSSLETRDLVKMRARPTCSALEPCGLRTLSVPFCNFSERTMRPADIGRVDCHALRGQGRLPWLPANVAPCGVCSVSAICLPSACLDLLAPVPRPPSRSVSGKKNCAGYRADCETTDNEVRLRRAVGGRSVE